MTKAERNAVRIKELEAFLISMGISFARPAEYHFKVNDINIYATTQRYFIDGNSSSTPFTKETLEALFASKGYISKQPPMRIVK